ncbi:hypothetical protein WH390_06925 [Candidatus Arsenophonus nilaparvatae]|nr:hypothetical protein [Candidatus Arsenophonus nilaparvatae]
MFHHLLVFSKVSRICFITLGVDKPNPSSPKSLTTSNALFFPAGVILIPGNRQTFSIPPCILLFVMISYHHMKQSELVTSPMGQPCFLVKALCFSFHASI